MPAKIPHDQIAQNPVHITYRLLGSIPKSVADTLKLRRDKALSMLEADITGLPEAHRNQVRYQRKFLIEGKYELALDDALHQATVSSPMFLTEKGVPEIVIDSWLFLQKELNIYIYAICVMGNHVHLIVRAPKNLDEVSPGPLMRRHKTHTSKKIKKHLVLNKEGIWDRTYFDRRIRTGKFNTVMWYVLNNPVKSGLVNDWRDWHGTYLNPDFDSLFRS